MTSRKKTGALPPIDWPQRPASAAFSTTARNFVFEKDLMLGPSDSYAMHQAAIAHQASPHISIVPLMHFYGEETAADHFMKASERHTGKVFSAVDASRSPWAVFTLADWEELKGQGYVAYLLKAAQKVAERGGKVYFSLADWSAGQYFADRATVQWRHDKNFADYLLGNACIPPMQGPHPSITNLEFGCLMETAPGQAIEVHFLDSQGEPVDANALRRCAAAAAEATGSAANREMLRQWWEQAGSHDASATQEFAFDAKATQAIRAMEALLAGSAQPGQG